MTNMREIYVTDEEGILRIITTINIVLMLGVGWMFYFGSLVLNFIYYLMHPSSPKMWTWGKKEKLEGWTPPEKTQAKDEEGELEPLSFLIFLKIFFVENISEEKIDSDQAMIYREEENEIYKTDHHSKWTSSTSKKLDSAKVKALESKITSIEVEIKEKIEDLNKIKVDLSKEREAATTNKNIGKRKDARSKKNDEERRRTGDERGRDEFRRSEEREKGQKRERGSGGDRRERPRNEDNFQDDNHWQQNHHNQHYEQHDQRNHRDSWDKDYHGRSYQQPSSSNKYNQRHQDRQNPDQQHRQLPHTQHSRLPASSTHQTYGQNQGSTRLRNI